MMRKVRRKANIGMFLLLLVSGGIYRYFPELVSFVTGTALAEIEDLSVIVVAKGFTAMFYIPWALVYAWIIATIVEPQLRQDAFGGLSRYGMVYCLSALFFILVVT